jgi:hypothetical protein
MQLGRTSNVKYTHYYGDGSGRDSHIICNNGGLTKQFQANMQKKPKGFSFF